MVTEDRTNKRDSARGVLGTGVLEPPPSEVRASEATASMVTDEIERFTEKGVLLKSGK
jgi:hypothetical protein